MYSALIGLLLLVQPLDVPELGQRVIAELRNGYRIEGVLVEKDHRSAVLSLEVGELRLQLKRVRQFHLPESSPTTDENSPRPGQQTTVRVSSEKAGEQQLSFRIPENWTKVDDESGALTYVDSQGVIRFRVEESAEAQSLWKITARLRRSHKAALARFEMKQERFGNRWTDVRTWEIDFEYSEGEERYRERRLYLDFGATKRVFTFRTPANSFSGLIGHFESITSGLALLDATTTPVELNPSPKGPPANVLPAKAMPLEALEQALEEEIQQALDESPAGR